MEHSADSLAPFCTLLMHVTNVQREREIATGLRQCSYFGPSMGSSFVNIHLWFFTNVRLDVEPYADSIFSLNIPCYFKPHREVAESLASHYVFSNVKEKSGNEAKCDFIASPWKTKFSMTYIFLIVIYNCFGKHIAFLTPTKNICCRFVCIFSQPE